MKLSIAIRNVQHIVQQNFSLDLNDNKLTCITGKNSVGKTTLIRAIRNLSIHNTFQETAAPYIFNKDSSITYSFDGHAEEIVFIFNKFINGIDSRQNISDEIKSMITVELSIPHGDRFNHFLRLVDLDEEIRAKIAVGEYDTPTELIDILNNVYRDDKFNTIRRVYIGKSEYYFFLRDESKSLYIREDYFSSGEYFVVSLYRQIKKRKKLIVIDEIDISLDASAQVRLIEILRFFCRTYELNILFTTHSLALIRTLEEGELYLMEKGVYDGAESIIVTPRSYNFIKSVMYGFSGFDRYILTEDECLEEYIRYLLSQKHELAFFSYHIIYVAGGSQVINLMDRNAQHHFLTRPENVIAALDGDQSEEAYLKGRANTLLLPFPSIEKEVYQRYLADDPKIPKVDAIEGKKDTARAKNLFWKLTRSYPKEPLMPKEEIYKYLEEINPDGVAAFRDRLLHFLNPKIHSTQA